MAWQIPQLGRLKSSSVAMKTAAMIRANLGPLMNDPSKVPVSKWMNPRSKGLVGHGSGRSCCTSTRRDPLESPEKGAGSLQKWKSRVQRLLQCPAHRGFLKVKIGETRNPTDDSF